MVAERAAVKDEAVAVLAGLACGDDGGVGQSKEE